MRARSLRQRSCCGRSRIRAARAHYGSGASLQGRKETETKRQDLRRDYLQYCRGSALLPSIACQLSKLRAATGEQSSFRMPTIRRTKRLPFVAPFRNLCRVSDRQNRHRWNSDLRIIHGMLKCFETKTPIRKVKISRWDRLRVETPPRLGASTDLRLDDTHCPLINAHQSYRVVEVLGYGLLLSLWNPLPGSLWTGPRPTSRTPRVRVFSDVGIGNVPAMRGVFTNRLGTQQANAVLPAPTRCLKMRTDILT